MPLKAMKEVVLDPSGLQNGQQPVSNSVNGTTVSTKTQNETVKLKPQISLFSACTIIMGMIIGSGIFVSPKGVLMQVRTVGLSLVIWLISGVFAMLAALCYAELGTTIPKSGGEYAYIFEAFGELPAFVYIWVTLFVLMPAGAAILSLVFANYLLKPLYPACDPPQAAVALLAACLVSFLTFLNSYNTKLGTKTQNIFAVIKILALAIIIVAGLVWIGLGNMEPHLYPDISFSGSRYNLGAIALAIYSGIFSYTGWAGVNNVTEELKNPYRDLPRAIYISMPAVTLIYMLANVAYFAVLSPEEVLASNAVAVTFAAKVMRPVQFMFPLFVACSTLGALNGLLFTSSRVFFVGARDQQLPEILGMINIRFLTPMPSLIFVSTLTMAMLALSDNVYVLINFAVFANTALMFLTAASLLYLRWSRPNIPRPIKLNLMVPIIFLLMCVFLLVCPFLQNPISPLVSVAMLVSGIPAYFIFVYWKNKPEFFTKGWAAFTHTIQRLLFCTPAAAEKEVQT